jgi:hypothetical protein
MDGDGTEYRVGLAQAPEAFDEVVSKGGAQVFIALELRDLFIDRLLDVEVDADPPHLVLRDPSQQVSNGAYG